MTIMAESTKFPATMSRRAGTKISSYVVFYNALPVPSDLTGEIDLGNDSFVYESKVTQVLQGRNVLLPLKVQVRVTSNYVSVTDLNSGIVGVGDSEEAAKLDFQQALTDYRDALAITPNLSTDLKSLLAYLVSIS